MYIKKPTQRNFIFSSILLAKGLCIIYDTKLETYPL